MRRVSQKRKKLNDQAREWRAAFVEELKVCEWCRKRKPIVHEIARGSGHRLKAMVTRYATLALCDPGCHQEVGLWSRAAQLALLKLRRPKDYDIAKFWELTARRWPYEEDVQACYERLKSEDA